jgi:hypothetical protein
VLSADSDAAHLEGELVAHYHAGPLGATTVVGTRPDLRDPRRSSGCVARALTSRGLGSRALPITEIDPAYHPCSLLTVGEDKRDGAESSLK